MLQFVLNIQQIQKFLPLEMQFVPPNPWNLTTGLLVRTHQSNDKKLR